MPITLPDLDDRRYEDLVDELVALIPRYAPQWTDHNASDPGIMLVELFSWLAEALIYRLNRVTTSSEDTFFKMLNGRLEGDEISVAGLDFKDAQALTVSLLKERWRAITAEDFEHLVLGMKQEPHVAARVTCLPEVNLEAADPYKPRKGHVSVILVPRLTEEAPIPSDDFIQATLDFLDQRRLITTRVHVVPPSYTRICVQIEVVPLFMESREDLKHDIETALKTFFHPLDGGGDSLGWPFGRPVYASEVYQVIEALTGVDYVNSLYLFKEESGLFVDAGNRIDIGLDNLVHYLPNHPLNSIRIVSRYE